MLKKFIVSIVITIVFSLSCSEPSDKTQGIIEYKISFPKIQHNHFMRDFLPDKMILKFKNNKYATEITAGMGMFKLVYFIDESNSEFSQYLKIFNKKYKLSLYGDEINEAMKNLPKMKVKKTPNTKTILGYKCNEAFIQVDNKDLDKYTVYYTDSIKIINPNWWNQYQDLEGTLLEYQYERYDICMHLKATKIKFKKIADEEFEFGDDYVEIDQERMDKEMEEIFSSFKED